jgi:hypothetical protein
MLHRTCFHIINIYYISGQNRTSELTRTWWTFGKIRASLQNKMCPFIRQCICMNVDHSFLMISYLGLHLDINSDKIDCFNFPIVNFPFICSNTPTARAYEICCQSKTRTWWTFGKIRASLQNKMCPFIRMLHRTCFHIINIYYISGQNRTSELLEH